jgi:plastocyanin
LIQREFRKFHDNFKGEEMKRIKLICGLAAILTTALALAAANKPNVVETSPDKPVAGAAIKIDNFSFGPATITIPVGSTVTWTNNDDVPHVVSSDDNKMFKSKALDTDDRFSFTFTNPGMYSYYCAIHPKMTAKIVVQ